MDEYFDIIKEKNIKEQRKTHKNFLYMAKPLHDNIWKKEKNIPETGWPQYYRDLDRGFTNFRQQVKVAKSKFICYTVSMETWKSKTGTNADDIKNSAGDMYRAQGKTGQ